MPTQVNHPQKRPRFDVTKKYQDIPELRSALRSQIPEILTEALTSIRNQLTVQSQDTTVAPQDDRLTFLKQWLESSPGAQDLFGIWDNANPRQHSFLALVVSLMSSIMTLLSFHYIDYALGQPVMKTLLNPSSIRRLHFYIGGSHNELIIVTLKLFNVMSKFAAGQYRKFVLESFPWELKSLPKLLNMRRKLQGIQDQTDPLTRPDIRTLYILLLLSFVDSDNSTQTKTAFIEQHREAFLAIFKGISQDHYSLARKILEVCWTGIWSDAKLKRTLKIGLFNEVTIGHLLKLYDRTLSDDDDDDHVPANLVHHFLLAICTRPGNGICFKDRGWYPRDSDPDDSYANENANESEEFKRKTSRIYNKILANVLKTLKVNENSRQQELATKIMMACPELVAGYWPSGALTLEPRLSSKWITNIGFFGCVISLPVPSASFYLPDSQLYQPAPPSLFTMIENILPSVQTKTHFSKGLLSLSGLVQHCTALALTKCLLKYQAVDAHLRKVVLALEEDEEDGQWSKRRRELEREVRRRVPDFQVVVAFSHQKHPDVPGGSTPHSNPTKIALLAESAQRLLWLYHCSLPLIVAEGRFELGKLLQTFTTEGGPSDQAIDAASRLYRVQQLHILNLLNESDQFVWTNKIGSLTHSPFCVLLRALASATIPAIRTALSSLLRHILSQSILFQEDPQESDLWLKALPMMRPSNGEEVSDGEPLSDEADAVITFLDDCVQRCLKIPYRYLEDVRSLARTLTSNAESEPNYSVEIYPSSLLMTIVEQLDAKVANKLLIPSHVLGITSFIRKLLFYLSTKQLDLQFLRSVAIRIDEILHPERLPEGFPIFSGAIRREVSMLHASLTFRHHSPSNGSAISSSAEVQAYLDRAEQAPLPTSKQLRASAAIKLVDWMRTVPHSWGTHDLERLVDVVIKVHLPAVRIIQEYWPFERTDLWEALGVSSRFSELRPYLNFEWLFLNTDDQQIMDKTHQTILSDTVFTQTPTLVELTRVVHLVMHAVAASRPQDEIVRAHLSIITFIFQQSKSVLPVASLDSLKELVFVRPGILKDVMMTMSSSEILQGVQYLSQTILSPASENDRKLVSDISHHWVMAVKGGLDDKDEYTVSSACVWIRYMESSSLLDLLDVLEERAHIMPTLPTLEVIKTVLEAFKSRTESESESTLKQHLPQLLSLRSMLPNFLLLEDLIAVAIEASLPIGLNGSPLSTTDSREVDFVRIINRANAHWFHRTHSLAAELDIRQFLNQDKFSDSTVRIISALVYRQCFSNKDIVEWLGTESCLRRQINHLLPIFHAVLDSSVSQMTSFIKSSTWVPYISPIVSTLADQNLSNVLRKLGLSCLINILSNAGKDLPTLLAVFTEEVNALTEKMVSLELISLGVALASGFGKDVNSMISILVSRGIQWMIDRYQFAGDHETMVHKQLADELASLIKLSSVSKPHLVETLLTVIIQGRFNDVSALKLAVICLSRTQFKPLIVNRHLQNIIQHSHFYKICTNNSPEVSSIRDAIIELLHSLFHLHPTNTCQITHVEPLVRIYRGTVSLSDLRILSILQLFENQRKLSVTSLLSHWSSTSNASCHSPLEALQSLDPILVLRTCLNFPRWRCVGDQSALLASTQDAHLYDPVFVMLLFGQMLVDQPPSSAFAWLELFRTNIISLFIRVLSSKDGQMRELALCQVVALWKQMEHADLQEKPHVLYILNMLKDTIQTHSNEPPRRLPSYTTLILMHALRGVFYPSNFIYPLTARFLLQRPELDTTDVPMLYGMLYSSSDDWKKERGWIIRFLSDGMMSTADWRVLKRRHTWELLASLYQGSGSNAITRQSILEVLANLTCNAQATNSLVLKSALLSWIEIQLLHSTVESVAWIKILENILIVVDSNKIETSTNGEWRSAIGRCLEYLLDERNCPTALKNLVHVTPVILRLSLLPGSPLNNLSALLDCALNCLNKFENEVEICSTVSQTLPTGFLSSLHHSSGLHQPCLIKDPLLLWGLMVEVLWRSAMTQGQKCPAWDLLMPKLLVWRTIVGGEGSQVGEWARTQVLRILAIQNNS